MRKIKKSLSVIMAVLMLLGSFAVAAFAADGETVEVSLRIEGIDNCILYRSFAVPEGATVLDVIKNADALESTLDVTIIDSPYGPYLSEINGLAAGSKTDKHFDGWNYMVNSQAPSVGMDFYNVSANDEIVVYYADTMGAGMQYPEANLKDITKGYISFTSKDTTYDENWNPVVTVNPVKDYVLVWGSDGATVEIVPDKNGVCKIPHKYLSWGPHSVQIKRFDDATGLPTVLRYADDYSIEVYTPETLGDYIVHMFVLIFEMIEDAFSSIVA